MFGVGTRRMSFARCMFARVRGMDVHVVLQ